jgi:hypothetical protein
MGTVCGVDLRSYDWPGGQTETLPKSLFLGLGSTLEYFDL